MNQLKHLAILSLIILLGCNETKKSSAIALDETAKAAPYKLQQTIYYGGDIVTMTGDSPSYVEAVVQAGR